MFRISPKLAGVAALLLFSILPALAQLPIDRGAPPPPCTVSPYYYNKKGDKPPPVYDPTEKHLMKRADTGAARMALSFQPNSVQIERGEPIVFTPKVEWPDGRLTGDLYAIYSPAGPPRHDMYLMPVAESGLPTGSGSINAVINPLNYYFHDGARPKPDPAPPIPSTIARLQDSRLDTDNMPLGKYWFTLQSAIQYPNGGGTCHKTSSIVLIEIVPPPPVPDFKIAVKAGTVSCQSIFANARIYDLKYAREEDISIRWELTPANNNLETSDNNRSASVRKGLIPETMYTFRAIGRLRTTGLERDAYDPVRYTCVVDKPAAGIVYFQFEVPDKKKADLMIVAADPESWTWGPRGKNADKYPTAHFSSFFNFYRQDVPAITDTANTDQLKVIVEKLREFPGYSLKIFGYADFQRTGTYSNDELSERRVKAALNYIRNRYQEIYGEDISSRLSYQVVTKAFGDSRAQTCEPYKWNDQRRWDRRAEMLYTPDPNVGPPDYEPAKDCPQPTRKVPPPRKGKKPRRR